ncbi:MAG: hypothetical protein E6Q97_15280 [Desulfurellales bacterium]|nr:MAG: hypothetical protein E6Q97_15280 [Desulfurellales bacterium]
MNTCVHPTSTLLHAFLSFPRWNFWILRCDSGCGEVFVKVEDGETGNTIATLPTTIQPYCTGAPQHGYSYYYHWDGLNHSTPPIAPAPNKEQA